MGRDGRARRHPLGEVEFEVEFYERIRAAPGSAAADHLFRARALVDGSTLAGLAILAR